MKDRDSWLVVLIIGSGSLFTFILSSEYNELKDDQTLSVIDHPISMDKVAQNRSKRAFIQPVAIMKDVSPALEPKVTLPKVMFLVITRRGAFEQRKAIRETWASGHANVLFIVGKNYCTIPPKLRSTKWNCSLKPDRNLTDFPADVATHAKNEGWLTDRVREEVEDHNDMILAEMTDVYRYLPRKVKLGYKYILENYPDTEWIVKVDDDVVVRVGTIMKWILNKQFNKEKWLVIGTVRSLKYEARLTGHKNYEADYRSISGKYPRFPLGSCGHIMSRPLAQWIVDHLEELQEYQGEDVSLGIWMDTYEELREKAHMVNVGISDFKGWGCKDTRKLIMGHRYTPKAMKECYEFADELDW